MGKLFLNHTQKEEITNLLMGRKVTKISDHDLELDNGVLLNLPDTEGGCACSAGDYDLSELNGVDNIITRVEFEDSPATDDGPYVYDHDGNYLESYGTYKIFVYADNQKVNLATWTGSDGNGYYGTGYEIEVKA